MHMDSAAFLEKEIDSLEQELMKKKKDLANLRSGSRELYFQRRKRKRCISFKLISRKRRAYSYS